MRNLLFVFFIAISSASGQEPPSYREIFKYLPEEDQNIYVDATTGKLTKNGEKYFAFIKEGNFFQAAKMLGFEISRQHSFPEYLDDRKTKIPENLPELRVLANSYLFNATIKLEFSALNMTTAIKSLLENDDLKDLSNVQFNQKLIYELAYRQNNAIKNDGKQLGPLVNVPKEGLRRLAGYDPNQYPERFKLEHIKYFVFKDHVLKELTKLGGRLGLESSTIIELASKHFVEGGRSHYQPKGRPSVFMPISSKEEEEIAKFLKWCLEIRIL